MTEPSPPGSDTRQESTTSQHEELLQEARPCEDDTAAFTRIFSSQPAEYTATDTVSAFQLLAQRRQDGALASTSEKMDFNAITQLVQIFLRQASNLPWRDLTSICISLATYGGSYEFGAMLQALEAEAVRRLKGGDSPKGGQSFSTLLHAFVVRGHKPGRDLLSVVTEGLRAGFKDLFPQDFVDTAQAYALLEHYPGVTFATELAQAFSQQVTHCKPVQLSMFLSAYVTLRHHPGIGLLEAIFAETLRHLGQYSMSNISTLIWAGASFDFGDIVKLLEPLLLHSDASALSPRDMARILWALAVIDALTEDVVAALGRRCARHEAEINFTGEACQQMVGAQLAMRTMSSQLHPVLEKEVVQALALWRQRAAETKPHAAAGAVAETLREMKVDAVERFRMDRGALVADIALPASQAVLLLEDRTSFCVNQRRQPMGQTILRRRWFERWKWEEEPWEEKPIKVISVAVHDWEALQSSAQRREFLQRALQGPAPLTQLPAVADTPPSSSAAPMTEAQLSMHSRSGSAESMAGVYTLASASGITAETMASLKLAGFNSLSLEPSLESSRLTEASSLLTDSSLRSGHSGPGALPSTASSFHEMQLELGHGAPGGLPPLRMPGYSDLMSAQTPSSGRSSQDALPASLQFLGPHPTDSTGNLSGLSQPRAQLPKLAMVAKQAAPNTSEYWEQVALASRMNAMSLLPRGPLMLPPLPQGSHGLMEGSSLDLPPGGVFLPQDVGVGQATGGKPYALQGPPQRPLQAQAPQMPELKTPFLPGGGYMGPLEMGEAPPRSGRSQGDLRQLWQMVTQVEPGQNLDPSPDAVSVVELKRVIELLPLETSAVAAVAPRLALLDPPKFAALLTELARDNHAFRAWQLFDWVRGLPEDNDMQRLCDSNTYTTMISLCGPWQQVRRALNLVADMRARSLECGVQAYSALLHAAVKCGEVELAVDVYKQMGAEGMAREKNDFQTMVDVLVKMGRHAEALVVLDDMRKAGQPAEVQLYNLIVLACTKVNNPRAALDVYRRMVQDGVQPNTKTFTALIGSVGKLNSLDQAMEIIDELLSHDTDSSGLTATYSALMSACEKAGQWDLAVALFDKISAQGAQPDVSIFNSMIAACAHGGEYNKARLMFERMAEHGCQADAVTYANLIRAYKKGGQWCHALDTFEAMQRSGCRPHAAVYSSIIDVLWQTGIAWAQAKALRLFNAAVENGSLAAAVESCKKGTLKVDLQALTVGVAVLSMAAWLTTARQALMTDQAAPLDASRKLAVVNGLGEHSRAQGHSAAVKEAVGAGLLGCKAPFKLVQDHSRSGRLEASSLALRKWLFSEAFRAYLSLLQGTPEMVEQPLMSTPDYLDLEMQESAKCQDLFQRILKYEAQHPVSLKVLHSHPGPYLAVRKQLVTLTLHCAGALQLSQETAHTALALMDRSVMSGMQLTDQLHTLMVCACLRVAALQESSFLPSPLAIQALTNLPAVALERMEANIAAALLNDTECVSAVHCLKVYLQRLGVDLGDGDAVRRAAGCAFALATQALNELPMLQFPPSLSAAAILVAARKAQGSVPFWPSVLAQLTGFTEAGAPAFASAIGHAERLCAKVISMPEAPFLGAMGL